MMQYHLFLTKARIHAAKCSLRIPIDNNVDAAEHVESLLYGIEEKGVKGIDNARHSVFATRSET